MCNPFAFNGFAYVRGGNSKMIDSIGITEPNLACRMFVAGAGWDGQNQTWVQEELTDLAGGGEAFTFKTVCDKPLWQQIWKYYFECLHMFISH